MKLIKCVNCGSEVIFSIEKKRCPECNCRNYGYNINNLPPIFQGGNVGHSSQGSKNNTSIKKPNLDFGWLVMHTEGKSQKSQRLNKGINYIGRENDNTTPHIIVKDDIYVSRGHAHITLKDGAFVVYDNSENQTGRASLNGTYINGNNNRLGHGGRRIFDGDNIQIGETKFILKTPDRVSNDIEAVNKVKEMDYTKTIIIQN